ncbi:unnamed protein product [Nezara viridula]|uniref:Uncharacterized protein n=1 Tax=Nezara viridula TaxID=85310 RepID=A0A9P0MIL8_NEZVI|nr:unnamed protein product [Nezara viridula]
MLSNGNSPLGIRYEQCSDKVVSYQYNKVVNWDCKAQCVLNHNKKDGTLHWRRTDSTYQQPSSAAKEEEQFTRAQLDQHRFLLHRPLFRTLRPLFGWNFCEMANVIVDLVAERALILGGDSWCSQTLVPQILQGQMAPANIPHVLLHHRPPGRVKIMLEQECLIASMRCRIAKEVEEVLGSRGWRTWRTI